ncbi:MAG: hypothetical protein RLZZ595_631, partial [Bacteroidota bacterium]
AMMRYLYNEMSPEEKNEFLSKVGENPEIQEEFDEIKEGFETLEDVQFSPSTSVIERIMQYGSAGEEAHSKK